MHYSDLAPDSGLVHSGQVAHDRTELIAPAPVSDAGLGADFTNMGDQLRQCCADATECLNRFRASADDVVGEVIYVLDADAGDAAAGPVPKRGVRPSGPSGDEPHDRNFPAGLPRIAGEDQIPRPTPRLTGSLAQTGRPAMVSSPSTAARTRAPLVRNRRSWAGMPRWRPGRCS